MPSKIKIAALLKEKAGLLPPTITAAFLAREISAALEKVDGTQLVSNSPTCLLLKIKPGTLEAGRYHKNIFSLLAWIFEKTLFRGKIELEINAGRKRIDIVFEKQGITGFFNDLETRHHIFCPKIFVECKNYTHDLKNPDFDQLVGRFHKRRGNFGILICRKIKDTQKAVKTCQDYLNADRGYVLFLQDSDILELVKLRKNSDFAAIDEFMTNKFDKLIL